MSIWVWILRNVKTSCYERNSNSKPWQQRQRQQQLPLLLQPLQTLLSQGKIPMEVHSSPTNRLESGNSSCRYDNSSNLRKPNRDLRPISQERNKNPCCPSHFQTLVNHPLVHSRIRTLLAAVAFKSLKCPLSLSSHTLCCSNNPPGILQLQPAPRQQAQPASRPFIHTQCHLLVSLWRLAPQLHLHRS